MEIDMTDRISAIRTALNFAESSYSKAMDRGDYDCANMLSRSIDKLWGMLVEAIRAKDPHTTEADIRFFENNA